VQALRLFPKAPGVAVGDRPGDRDEERSLEQGLAIVGLDRVPAPIAYASILTASNGTRPPWSQAPAEIATHEHMFA
jgi:hypothetical protein